VCGRSAGNIFPCLLKFPFLSAKKQQVLAQITQRKKTSKAFMPLRIKSYRHFPGSLVQKRPARPPFSLQEAGKAVSDDRRANGQIRPGTGRLPASSRRPVHLPAPEEVEVDMIDALPGLGVCVHQQAETPLGNPSFFRDLPCCPE